MSFILFFFYLSHEIVHHKSKAAPLLFLWRVAKTAGSDILATPVKEHVRPSWTPINHKGIYICIESVHISGKMRQGVSIRFNGKCPQGASIQRTLCIIYLTAIRKIALQVIQKRLGLLA